MNTLAYPEIIGLDVSRDWLGIHCLTDDLQLRLPNTNEGHSRLEELASGRSALICFEATGGHEWRLWANLEAAATQPEASARIVHKLSMLSAPWRNPCGAEF